MRRQWLMTGLLIACSWYFIPGASAAEKDLVSEALEKAKAEYAKSIENAQHDYSNSFDASLQEVAKTGNLEAVKSLRSEKKTFEAEGKLATSQGMKKATLEFQKTIDSARKSMLKAYDTAVIDYTKQLRIDEADAVNGELAAFKLQADAKLPKPSVKSSPFDYKFYTWNVGQQPIKMIHKNEGFCYLTVINGAFDAGSEGANIEIKDDGYWYLWGTTRTGFLRLQAVAVKMNPSAGAVPAPAAATSDDEIKKLKQLLTSKDWFFHWEEKTRSFPIRYQPDGHVKGYQAGDWKIEPLLAIKQGTHYLIRVDDDQFRGFFIPTGRQVGIFSDESK